MSHSYYDYETEEQRQKRLLMERIARIKNELRSTREFIQMQGQSIKSTPSVNVNLSNDIYESTYVAKNDLIEKAEVKVDSSVESFRSDGSHKEILNLSEYLLPNLMMKDDEVIRLQSVLSKIDLRVIDSEKGRIELDRLKSNINEIVRNNSYDIEDIINLVDQRITIFLENEHYDNTSSDEDLLLDYKTLCILLGKEEKNIELSKLKSVVDSMLEEYLNSTTRICVADEVKDAFENLGYRVVEYCSLDGDMKGELYSNDSSSDVKLFVSYTENGIMFEPVINNSDDSEEKRNEAQKRGCESQKELIKELRSRGIILSPKYSEEVPVDMIASEADLSDREILLNTSESKQESIRRRNNIIRRKGNIREKADE